MEKIKIISTNVLILVLVTIFFDVTMFFFLPNDYAFNFYGYRDPFLDQTFSTPGGENSIRDYYVRHEKRGFDIGENKHAYHKVNQTSYPIWSNSIGCFDKEHTQYAQYVYLTGDSMTWGYTPYNEKFGTIIEDLTGAQILKCGISHTGQQQQYDKFIEIEQKIGVLPKAIIVFYCPNDISNDYAYPHSTVIDGYLVDNVGLDKAGNLIDIPEQELRESVAKKVHDLGLQGPNYYSLGIRNVWGQKFIRFLRQYSLSAQLVISVIRQIKTFMERTDSANERALNSIYFLDGFNGQVPIRNGQYWYSDNPKAISNQKAIAAFQKFSIKNGIHLVMVLIPPPVKSYYANTKFYEQLRNFLTENEIRFVDLTFSFHKNQWPVTDLYWRYDGHLSPSGNKIVADILIKELPEVFSGMR